MTETQYDPSDYTVDQVNDYLADADDAERERVLDAERTGKNRVGIVGEQAEPTDPSTQGGALPVTEAASEPQAGEKYEKGYEGYVPSRDGDNPVDLTLSAVTSKDA